MFGFGKGNVKEAPKKLTEEEVLEGLDFAPICSVSVSVWNDMEPCESQADVIAKVKCPKCGSTSTVNYCLKHFACVINDEMQHARNCRGILFPVSHVSIK